MTVFVDTSVWYAAADDSDSNHRRAAELLANFTGQLVTSDHVLVETWFLAEARMGRTVAETLTDRIRRGVARIECAVMADLEKASAIAEAFTDQNFSLVDRTCWAIMERLGIHEVISFDSDFAVYRFGQGRRRSFVVHR